MLDSWKICIGVHLHLNSQSTKISLPVSQQNDIEISPTSELTQGAEGVDGRAKRSDDHRCV
jgi:hypothetical protein